MTELPNPAQCEYYQRTQTVLPGGHVTFKTELDEENERQASMLISLQWQIKVGSFGRYAPIDYYLETFAGQHLGYAELKCRTIDHDKHKETWLNLRKFNWLFMTALGAYCEAFYLIKFNDGIWWIDIFDIRPKGKVRQAGTVEIVKSRNDKEPVIFIPIQSMHPLCDTPSPFAPPPVDAIKPDISIKHCLT